MRDSLSDFVEPEKEPLWKAHSRGAVEAIVNLLYGQVNTCTLNNYAAIAEQAGLCPCFEQDLTAETMPTYDILSLMTKNKGIQGFVANWINQATATAQGSRNILYKVLAYEKLG